MSNKVFYIGLVLVIIGLNINVLSKELEWFGVYGAFAVCAFILIIYLKSIAHKIVLGACIIVLKMLMVGEILLNRNIETELFNTTEYNYVFYIQLLYVLGISSLIGLYYAKKIKCRK